jgi:hypothetical protein
VAVRMFADRRCCWTLFVKPRRLSQSSPSGPVVCFVSDSFTLGIRRVRISIAFQGQFQCQAP